jgi:hypothetical protein
VKIWKRILIVVVALGLLALGAFTYMVGGPRNLIGMLRYDQREEGKLQVGDRTTPVKLSDHLGGQPTVLIFGSFT